MLASEYFHYQGCLCLFLLSIVIISGCIEEEETVEIQEEEINGKIDSPLAKEATGLVDLDARLSPEKPTIYDNVTLFLDLVYPTAGYRINFGCVTKTENNFAINITAVPPFGVSAQVITRYSHKYDLGKLPEDRYNYKVFLNGRLIMRQNFDVKK